MIFHKNLTHFLAIMLLLTSSYSAAVIKVGIGYRDITPPIGSPSAGCLERDGGMLSVHDPLLAQALVIDTGRKKVAFCSVDHLGFLRSMVNEVAARVHAIKGLEDCEVFIGSTHTHSGGGGHFDIPGLGDIIAGSYDGRLVSTYIAGATRAIMDAYTKMQPALIGLGYGSVSGLTSYEGTWPKNIQPPTDIVVLKVTKLDGSPLALWYNYALYPDVLVYSDVHHPLPDDKTKMAFSADAIGYVNHHIRSTIGNSVATVFFNGPIGEVLINIPFPTDRYASCTTIGYTLGKAVCDVWQKTRVSADISIEMYSKKYLFEPQPTLAGFVLPVETFDTEISLIIINKSHAFVTIPAELHCSYDGILKEKAQQLGFANLTILSMVNDNHGYIYPPEAWRLNPPEGEFSWGGEFYGKFIEESVIELLNQALIH